MSGEGEAVDELDLVGGHLVGRVDRVDGALGKTRIAGGALVRVDVQHRVTVEELQIRVGRMLVDDLAILRVATDEVPVDELVDALDGTDVDARRSVVPIHADVMT